MAKQKDQEQDLLSTPPPTLEIVPFNNNPHVQTKGWDTSIIVGLNINTSKKLTIDAHGKNLALMSSEFNIKEDLTLSNGNIFIGGSNISVKQDFIIPNGANVQIGSNLNQWLDMIKAKKVLVIDCNHNQIGYGSWDNNQLSLDYVSIPEFLGIQEQGREFLGNSSSIDVEID